MTDRPILFSAPMVRAILAGRKTQTRRIIKPQPHDNEPGFRGFPAGDGFTDCVWGGVHCRWGDFPYFAQREARYQVGDRLWVREAWAPLSALTHNDPSCTALAAGGFYRVDNSTVDGEVSRWRASIHMPRRASRLTLVVTEVRVQRLQDISAGDAVAEGIIPFGKWHEFDLYTLEGETRHGTAVSTYAELWRKINGPDAWDANPWVAAYTFSFHRCNIGALEAMQ